MSDLIDILNLGAGVQSSTVLLMSIAGELPKPHHIIFADTGWEPAAVYQQLEYLAGLAASAGMTVNVVGKKAIREDSLRGMARGKAAGGERWASLPFFTLGPDGSHGQVRRQCTSEYKIQPIEKFIRREILGLKHRQHAPKEPVVRRWYGISFDELQRMRVASEKWAVNWYPLIERRMTRVACYKWLHEHGYPEAPRSACIGCPFHSAKEWREMKEHRPDEWEDAVAFDKAIRKCGGMRGDVFIHPARVPLDEVQLYKRHAQDQMMFTGWDDECSGICGV